MKRLFVHVFWLFVVVCLAACNGDEEWIYAETPIPPLAEREGKPLVVVVGDSIAAGWQVCNPTPCEGIEFDWWQDAIGNVAIVRNRGIGNSTTTDLLNRWQQDTQDAEILIILIGINDAFREKLSADAIFDNLETMVQRATDAGRTPIVATLLPFDRDENPQAYATVLALNQRIRQQATWQVLDLYQALAETGEPRPDEMATMLHPNQQGYTRLAAYVRDWWQAADFSP